MAGLELSPYQEEHAQARYGRVELEKLGRTVLVQYYVCNSSMPCVKVLGYIPAGRHARRPAGLEQVPEPQRGIVRRCVMVDTAARYRVDAPLVCFGR